MVSADDAKAQAVVITKIMRRESRLRTFLLIIVVSVIPCLIVGTSFPFQLSDLVFPFGPPLSHILHAGLLFAGTFALLWIAYSIILQQRFFRRGPGPKVGPKITSVLQDLAQRIGISAEVQVFGGLKGRGVEAVAVGRRRIVRIAINRLREVNTQPEAFRFTLAHELAHLASGDPRTDRLVGCAYLTATCFILVAYGSVLWTSGSNAAMAWRFGADAVANSLRTSAFTLIVNALSMGSLALLLFFERRSAQRLREFHADAVAIALVGPEASAIDSLDAPKGYALAIWFRGFISDHPKKEFRRRALNEQSVAFQADRILFILQGYFSAVTIEMILQLLFVNASTGVSSFAERNRHLLSLLERFPWTVASLLGVGAVLVSVSGILVFERLKILRDTIGTRHYFILFCSTIPLLIGTGLLIGLATSQTVVWELSGLGWRLDALVQKDPERISIHTAYLTGVVIAIIAIITDRGRWSMSSAGTVALAVLPIGFVLAIGVWFHVL